MKITWQKTVYYEWTGVSEGYVIMIVKTIGGHWYWKVYGGNGEYSVLHSFNDDDYIFPDADLAKAAAEQALQNYLKEKETA